MLELLRAPWPWYVSGAIIAALLMALLFFGKTFGFSSNFRTLCAMCGAGRTAPFFQFNWKGQLWNLVFLVGAVIGGALSALWLSNGQPVAIADATVQDLALLGFAAPTGAQPEELYGLGVLGSLKGVLLLVVGGFLVGFGSRWAGGCTSGHAITGLSSLQLPSLIAVVGFFIGGLAMTHLIYPILF